MFSASLILFVTGAISQTLLLSLAFKKSSFATQLGSLILLVPLIFTFYLKVKSGINEMQNVLEEEPIEHNSIFLFLFPHHAFTSAVERVFDQHILDI